MDVYDVITGQVTSSCMVGTVCAFQNGDNVFRGVLTPMFLQKKFSGVFWALLALVSYGCELGADPGTANAGQAIAGGTDVNASKYPGVVLVYGYQNNNLDPNNPTLCWTATGLVIASNMVATAAHVVENLVPSSCQGDISIGVFTQEGESHGILRKRHLF
ncbi:MAG: hypothetical protein IPJ88_17810 [Myxococcales bacterium]|nr:MAG: hypothetical protein IPJ88_17810 [Myxococcales bacterium]